MRHGLREFGDGKRAGVRGEDGVARNTGGEISEDLFLQSMLSVAASMMR
jgi:hypothetical protein